MRDYVAPPMRQALPTVPCDLREYARIHTGPGSWSARADHLREVLTEPDAMQSLLEDEPLSSVVDGPLVDVRRSDIPLATKVASYVGPVLDGAASLGDILDRASSGEADVLEALCDLYLRGVVIFTACDGSVRELDAE
jgi:hypothetical protein